MPYSIRCKTSDYLVVSLSDTQREAALWKDCECCANNKLLKHSCSLIKYWQRCTLISTRSKRPNTHYVAVHALRLTIHT